MLHKRFVFVSLLAPSLSFASTATDSLANSTRDVFDNLDENPAFVNVEGGKSYLRIGKGGGAQAITTVGGFGLGIQANTLAVAPVDPLEKSKDFVDTMKAVRLKGMPLALTLGGGLTDMKWGAKLRYFNAKVDGAEGVVFDPSIMKTGLSLGVNMGETEAALGFDRDTFKAATTGKTKTIGAETTKPLADGFSEQTTDSLNVLVRHKMGGYQWFVTGKQSKTKAKFWDKTKSSNTANDDFNKVQSAALGAQREDKLAEGMMLFSKTWFDWSKTTSNYSKDKLEVTTTDLRTAHGLEFSAASWATLRAGVEGKVYGVNKITSTVFADDNQVGASAANGTTSTFVLGAAAPTMGVGFKFGNFMVDATVAQDGTDTLGFSDKVLGNVEVTAQF